MPKKSSATGRIKLTFLGIMVCLGLISARLFYWQVIKSQALTTQAVRQTTAQDVIKGQRGRIFTVDGHLLVGNQTVYDLYVNKREIKLDQLELINKLVDIFEDYYQTSPESDIEINSDEPTPQPTFHNNPNFNPEDLRQSLTETFSRSATWLRLERSLPTTLKDKIEQERFAGIHLIEEAVRYYPEGSMAAHITGFLGKDEDENSLGYFGIEGALDKELKEHQKFIKYKKDAKGTHLADQKLDFSNLDGRDIILTIRRDIQFIANNALVNGIKTTGSKNGSIVIMEPSTGAILALAAWPNYDPAFYFNYATESYRNPTLADLFEPGSIFKIFTLAIGLDTDAITPQTVCTRCAGPRIFGSYTIKTWNEQYHPDINMTEALKKSDNTALVFAVEQIGHDPFVEYLQKFGIGEEIKIDLQEDRPSPFKTSYRPVELANASFGQGFYTNVMQMVRAAGAIANQGVMMKPYIVEQVSDSQTQDTITYDPEVMRRVIEKETAQEITKMMIHSAPDRGSLINQHYLVAGKTGTAQIAEAGGYRERGTIASYIGFAPANDPKFVMMVKLNEPQNSPWAEATAVPIWYEVADKIILML